MVRLSGISKLIMPDASVLNWLVAVVGGNVQLSLLIFIVIKGAAQK